MAKKKRMGKTSYTSKGERKSSRGCRSLTPAQRLLNQTNAWLKGKRVMLVINAAGHKVFSLPEIPNCVGTFLFKYSKCRLDIIIPYPYFRHSYPFFLA